MEETGSKNLLELPMHIQDSALFYKGRMGLDEIRASSICRTVLDTVRWIGGVLTINWHERSLAPERNWEKFYLRLIKTLEEFNPWFAQVSEVINWFAYRRSVEFLNVFLLPDRVSVQISSIETEHQPLRLRVYLPEASTCARVSLRWVEQIWNGQREVKIPFRGAKESGTRSV
jgi:hypothetical protein